MSLNKFNKGHGVVTVDDEERRASQQMLWLTGITLVVFLGWAAFFDLEEITRGQGRVIPASREQVVQSLDGGVVSEILVSEGEVVEAGQLLLKIDETRATSGVRESAAQGFSLRARQARLRALAEGAPFQPPASTNPEEAHILSEERMLYETRRSELGTMIDINQQQLQQRQQELAEMRSRKAASRAFSHPASMWIRLHKACKPSKPCLASQGLSLPSVRTFSCSALRASMRALRSASRADSSFTAAWRLRRSSSSAGTCSCKSCSLASASADKASASASCSSIFDWAAASFFSESAAAFALAAPISDWAWARFAFSRLRQDSSSSFAASRAAWA